jgi:dihydrodipicolinate synthase/N-acetylneuraminate lyase
LAANLRSLGAATLLTAASAFRKRSPYTSEYQPPAGLSVPVISVLDREGRILADEQRAVVDYAIQNGKGANIIFAAGTTGEWNRLDPADCRTIAAIVVEQCREARRRGNQVEAWVGITAHTRAATLHNLEHAIEIGADAVVVAPLSIIDIDHAPEFVERSLSDVFARSGRSIPVFLYDNADIAVSGKAEHLHTRDVKRMSELPYVFGIKVTASRAVLGNYTRAAAHFRPRGAFAIYPGNAYLIFDLLMPARGLASRVHNYWNRYLTRNALPHGVVAGGANTMPREWRRAWQICAARELPLIDRYRGVLQDFASIAEFTRGGHRQHLTIACLKAALKETGVIESDSVAEGTPSLETAEKREFVRRFRELCRRAAVTLEPEWLSSHETAARIMLAASRLS